MTALMARDRFARVELALVIQADSACAVASVGATVLSIFRAILLRAPSPSRTLCTLQRFRLIKDDQANVLRLRPLDLEPFAASCPRASDR